jgi:uncharacterized protein YbaP (TraB family)
MFEESEMRFLTTFAAAVALPGFGFAQCSGTPIEDLFSPAQTAAVADAVAQTPYPDGLFWEATRGEDRVILAGTMHLPDPRHDALVERLRPEIEAADQLLVEMTDADEKAMLAAMANDPSLIYLTEGPTLIDLVDEETWAQISEAASDRMIPPIMAAKFQPWFLMITLSIPSCAMADMQSGLDGLDGMLMEVAAGASVPVRSLEPWDTIFSLFADMPMEEQIAMLSMGLLSPEQTESLFASTLDAYFSGEVAHIWELSRVAMEFVPGITPEEADEIMARTEAELLIERNIAWIPEIEAAVAEHDRVVVAAGAAHLPGEQGVLRLLEDAGWTIAPLR